MRFFACVVGAICKSPYAVACVFSSNSPALQNRPCFQFPHVEGRIAHILRCASSRTLPLHVCFLDVRKYVNTQKTSWAWYEYVCARCRGELQFALCSCVRFCLESPMFSIAPMWKGELQFAPTRVLSERWQISCKYM